MWVSSPRSVTLSYRGMIQYLVIAVAGEFPSSGKENGYQRFLSLSGLLDFCLKDEVSKFPVPSITAAKMFPNLQLMEIVLNLQPSVFLASEFHCPCSGLCAWQIWCISHFLSEESARGAQQWGSEWQHTADGGNVVFPGFYKYLESFLFMELAAGKRPRRKLLTPQRHSARCSSWLTPETETVWLQSCTFVHRLVGGSAGWGAEEFPPMQRQYQPVPHN